MTVYSDFEEKCGILLAPGQMWLTSTRLMVVLHACPSGTQKFVSGSAIACGIRGSPNSMFVSVTASVPGKYTHKFEVG